MLTDAHCRNATCPPDKKRARFTDAAGLYLEVSPTGFKRWFFKIYAEGKESRIALGSYPAVSLSTARQARDAAKKKRSEGVDLVLARKIDKLKSIIPGADTFAATARADRDITGDLKRALKPHTKKNLPAIVNPVELGELLRASDGYKGGAIVRAALALAPILFQRPGNLRTMRWQDVDRSAGLWSIPSEDMKRTVEGKINGQPHVVPLPRQALAILEDLHPLTGGGVYVLPGLRNAKAPLSEAGVGAALNAMGYKSRHTWHGYRATGRTILRQVLRYPGDVIEAQLAHVGQITHGGAYDRSTHLEERTAMVQVWANYLDKLRTGADVIPLASKAA